MRTRMLGLLSLCLPLLAAAAQPPVTQFTNFPRYDSLKISPKGTYLALTRRTAEFEVLTVLTYPELKVANQSQFGTLTDIAYFDWANDSRILIGPARRFPGYNTFKVPTGEIIGINANGKAAELLFGYQAGQMQTGTHVTQRESMEMIGAVIGRVSDRPNEVLMQTYGYGFVGDYNAVYRMNIGTGRLSKLAASPLRDGTFITDRQHQVTLVHGEDYEGNHQVFMLTPKHEWERLSSTGMRDGSLEPLGPTSNAGEYLALDDRDAPTRAVIAWVPDKKTKTLLYRNPDVDMAPIGYDPENKPWGFVYIDHFPQYWYPDPEHPLAKMHKWLTENIKGHNIGITSQTDDMSIAVAEISAPRTPPRFLVVDVKHLKVLQDLAAYPDVQPKDLATVDPIELTARDGMKIRGYLTVPNVASQKKLPMIVLVHGGPHGIYDTYEFNWEAQLFASRGYAVLQVNYRGSGGRGRRFEGAGYGRWGREMQDDVTDAVRWAIGDGVADARRICIYGGSYGAYSALTGAFREPDMFKCAVGLAGVYDLPLMFEKGDIRTAERGVNYLRAAIGTDVEELKRRSPVYNADKIKAKVFLLHGKIDERAPYEHAVRMRDALTKAGNPPEWFTEWGEGHGFFDEGHREEAYTRILAFFEKNLGPQVTSAQN